MRGAMGGQVATPASLWQPHRVAEPWLDGDTPSTWEEKRAWAWGVWRGLGRHGRTLDRLVAATGMDAATLRTWIAQGNWVAQAQADDAADAVAARAHDPNPDHAALLADCRELSHRELRKMLDLSRTSADPVLAPTTLIRLMEKAVQLDRLIRDQATVIGGGADWEEALDQLPDEELARMRAALPPADG